MLKNDISSQVESVILPLLAPDEVDIPEGVLNAVMFCTKLGFDFTLFRSLDCESESLNHRHDDIDRYSDVELKSVCFLGYDERYKSRENSISPLPKTKKIRC